MSSIVGAAYALSGIKTRKTISSASQNLYSILSFQNCSKHTKCDDCRRKDRETNLAHRSDSLTLFITCKSSYFIYDYLITYAIIYELIENDPYKTRRSANDWMTLKIASLITIWLPCLAWDMLPGLWNRIYIDNSYVLIQTSCSTAQCMKYLQDCSCCRSELFVLHIFAYSATTVLEIVKLGKQPLINLLLW